MLIARHRGFPRNSHGVHGHVKPHLDAPIAHQEESGIEVGPCRATRRVESVPATNQHSGTARPPHGEYFRGVELHATHNAKGVLVDEPLASLFQQRQRIGAAEDNVFGQVAGGDLRVLGGFPRGKPGADELYRILLLQLRSGRIDSGIEGLHGHVIPLADLAVPDPEEPRIDRRAWIVGEVINTPNQHHCSGCPSHGQRLRHLEARTHLHEIGDHLSEPRAALHGELIRKVGAEHHIIGHVRSYLLRIPAGPGRTPVVDQLDCRSLLFCPAVWRIGLLVAGLRRNSWRLCQRLGRGGRKSEQKAHTGKQCVPHCIDLDYDRHCHCSSC